MALQKQAIPINFSQGLDTKSDPKQVQLGKFLALQNSVFDKAGSLVKRNGFANITSLPNANQTTLTTLNDNLLATGSNLYAYSKATDQWLNQGIVQPVQLRAQTIVRSSTNQTAPDSAIADSGLACIVYVDNGISYYEVADSNTGQQIVGRQALPATATNPRVVLLNRFFIITFVANVGITPHLQFIAVPISVPTSPQPAADLSPTIYGLTAGYDVYVANNRFYFAWRSTVNTTRVNTMSDTLVVGAPFTITSSVSDLVSITAEISNTQNIVYVSYQDNTLNNGYTTAFSNTSGFLVQLFTPVQVVTSTVLNRLTSVSLNGILTLLFENNNTYSYAPNAQSNYISKRTVTSLGVVSASSVVLRSVGLASKAFVSDVGTIYALTTYGGANQPTCFLIDSDGNIYMRLAYANGGGYLTSQVLPSVSLVDGDYHIAYLVKDFLTTTNKNTNIPAGQPSNAIYTQTGINLAEFSINAKTQYSSEIAGSLHLTGGMTWQYDSVKPVEHGFHVWPEDTTATVGSPGTVTAGTYYYVFTYEWTDNQGNLHRSAPSIPITVTVTGNKHVDINVPTLRLTYKISPNPVRIVGYRWSVAQQTYYQFTSITAPVINDTTVDSIAIVDNLTDAQILGNPILYTTGGVVENIAAPASIHSALFKNRLFLIDAENRNLLWFSKQVIDTVPVEMSDLLTIYIAPTSGAQGSTGPMTALGAMDDKLIIFKRDAIYYITGQGPDNTGANNDFTDAIYITSAVGCANPSSIVLTPNGIMFSSDKGIWLLGRDLNTTYIGAPVEGYNDIQVMAAQTIPGTNQVRFTLANNITLMYDYYYGQWGTFNNTFAISATLFNGVHTYLDSYGRIFKETTDGYLDGSQPVLLSLTTSWINVAGVQGYERLYEMLLLGTYFSPFKLNVKIAYDYNEGASQATIVTPSNYAKPWGGEAKWGSGGPWGGPGNVFEARIFPQIQKCESFRVTIEEIYDPAYNVAAGQGLNMSGLSLLIGMKKGHRTQKASQSFG